MTEPKTLAILQGSVMAHYAVVVALLRTHPRPSALAAEIDEVAEAFVSKALASTQIPDAAREQFESVIADLKARIPLKP